MECEVKKCAGIPVPPEPKIPPEVELMIKDDKQFWNYCDILPDETGETPRWKYHYPQMWELFDWLLWGMHGKFWEVQASPVLLMEAERHEIQALGKAQVTLVQVEETIWLVNGRQSQSLTKTVYFPMIDCMVQGPYE